MSSLLGKQRINNSVLKTVLVTTTASSELANYLRCRQCGDHFVLPRFSPPGGQIRVKHEFATIKLGDIFTNYDPQRSSNGNDETEVNDQRSSDDLDLCSSCMTYSKNGVSYNIEKIMKNEILDSSRQGQGSTATSVITSHVNHNGNSSSHSTSPIQHSLSQFSVSSVFPNGGVLTSGNHQPMSIGSTTINHVTPYSNPSTNNVSLTSQVRENSESMTVLTPSPELLDQNKESSTRLTSTSVSTIRLNLVSSSNGNHSIGSFESTTTTLPSFVCNWCNKNFKNERLAAAHMEKVHSKVARYNCNTCEAKFCYRGALNSHVASHHPRASNFDCSDCGKKFKGQSFLNAHHTLVHATPNPRVFKCEFCPSAFSKRVNLNYHRKRKHTEETAALPRPLISPIISNSSNSPTMNNKSQFLENPNEVELSVGSIREQSTPLGMIRESPDHSLLMNFDNSLSSSAVTIIDTIASNTNILPSGLSKSSETEQPKKVEATEKPEGDFKCQYCGRGFLFRNNLKCHLRTHIRDKKYTCEICEKSFIYKESLKNHMLLHSNELPYNCDICGKKFRDRSNRRKHVKNVHKFLIANGGGNSNSTTGNNGTGDLSSTFSTSTSSRSIVATPPKKRTKRSATKNKELTPATSEYNLPSTLPMTIQNSPPQGQIGVIVSPKSSEQFSSQSLSSTQAQVLPYERNIIKSEMSPPEVREQESQEYHIHAHSQHPPPHYSMHHPNVIVYSKTKIEPVDYTSPPMGSPETSSHGHNIMGHTHAHYYQENYANTQSHVQQHEIPSYVSLMIPPQSISPENNTTGSSYDSPASPYVVNMRLRSNSTTTNPSEVTQLQHVTTAGNDPNHSNRQPQHPYSPSLMYSSPMMGMGSEGGGGYETYWQPTNENGGANSRVYYGDTGQQIPTVTEGTVLHPQSPYGTLPHPPPNQTTPNATYFYTDLAQFDFSHL